MKTAVINVKVQPEVKKEAQRMALELGFSLSTLINAYLKQFIRTKTAKFTIESYDPTLYLKKALKESKKDIDSGRVSKSFDDINDAIAWLEDPKAKYKNGDSV